jgi:hypothetical protein
MKVFNPTIKFLSKIVLLSLVIASVVFACKDNTKELDNNNSNTQNVSYLSFDGLALNHLNATKNNIAQGDGYIKPINILVTSVSSDNLTEITAKSASFLNLEDLDNLKVNPEFVVFYLKNENFTNVEFKNIVGISIWTSKGNNTTEHRLYRLNTSGKFELDKTFNSICNIVLKKDITYLATNVLKNEPSINWISYHSNNSNKARKTIAADSELKTFRQIVMDNADYILTGAAQSDCTPCGYSCPGGYCDSFNECQCSSATDCVKSDVITTAKSARIANNLSLDISREIRDNTLSKSQKGKDYIDYYYKISAISNAYDVVNVNNVYDHIALATDLIQVTNKFNSTSKEVIIDNDLKNGILEMVNSYKEVSKNKEFQNILKTIETDVKNLSLKEKQAVLNYIK